jgi:hypothetical protein
MASETKNKFFDDVVQNIRKTAEANLKMQQEFFDQWTSMWPGLPKAQNTWVEQARDFQKKWAEAVSELAHKHQGVLQTQYDAALKSLDQALQVAESADRDEFRQRVEEFYRKTLDCLRESSEAQIGEFKNVVSKWTELITESAAQGGAAAEKK